MLDTAFFGNELIPALNRGLLVSLALIIPAGSLGFVGGVLLGCARSFGPRWLRRMGDWFTAIVRGVPLVVQLMMIYYALPKLGIFFPPYGAALTSFILCTAAYQSEYVRGALLSIRQGQIRAAEALGFSTWQTVAWIIIPQAARRALPGCGNEFIYLIKYSSLASAIVMMDLTGEAAALANTNFRYTEVYLPLGAYYLFLTSLSTLLVHRIEKKLAIPGFGVARARG